MKAMKVISVMALCVVLGGCSPVQMAALAIDAGVSIASDNSKANAKRAELKRTLAAKKVKTMVEELKAYENKQNYVLAVEVAEKLAAYKSEYENLNSQAYNYAAWFYASCPDEKYRNGEKAVEYAMKSVSVIKWAENLDTLACAYAEKGDFEKAVSTETEAYERATNGQLKAEFRERIDLFKSGKTYAQREKKS